MPFIIEIDPMTADPNVLGEYLRSITFVGKGFGCYEDFTVRSDAIEQHGRVGADILYPLIGDVDEYAKNIHEDYKERSKAYTFWQNGYKIYCAWMWDGDGELGYEIWKFFKNGECSRRSIINRDCKKDYIWQENENSSYQ